MAFIRSFILALILCFGMPQAEAAAAGPSVLFDPATGEALSQDRAGEPWYPASLTKLMTAYIVFHKLKTGRLGLEQKVTVSELASAQAPSKIGIKAGGTVSVDFALQALLVYSANDMATALAEAAAGTVPDFAGEMNAAALRLGMSGSHFVNPNGLFDPRHISTARDIAILAAALLKEFPKHGHYFSQEFVAVGKRRLSNRNSLIRQMPEADGMKTGFVCNSGFNLVATATRDGRRLGAVIFGANSGKHRADLAEMLLVDGFTRVAAPRQPLQQIVNMKTGSVVPADMTTTVCRKKAPVTIASAKDLGGWGVSFGNYESATHADMALRGRLLTAAGMALPGQPGIVRLPGKGGFAAMLWNLDLQKSAAACAAYRTEKAPCEVVPPRTFAEIAALTPEPAPRPVQATAQGSDTGKKVPARKTKRKKKRI